MKELDIRYIKLYFVLTIMEDTVQPVCKASGIRGGIGEMLLREVYLLSGNSENILSNK